MVCFTEVADGHIADDVCRVLWRVKRSIYEAFVRVNCEIKPATFINAKTATADALVINLLDSFRVDHSPGFLRVCFEKFGKFSFL